MERSTPNVWLPALIGGAVFGIAGAIPILNFLNCLCCSLVIGSGFLAAFLYSKECRRTDTPFGGGGGAKVGVLSGVFYTVFGSTVQWVLSWMTGAAFDFEEAIAQIESNPQIPAETADGIIRVLETFEGSGMLMLLPISLVIALIFATIGGLIGGAVFKVEPAVPPESAP
jgi:hypothetical protein